MPLCAWHRSWLRCDAGYARLINDRLVRRRSAPVFGSNMTSVIDHEPAAQAPVWRAVRKHAWRERWIGLWAEMAERPEREVPKRADAEPIGNLAGNQRAKNAAIQAAAVDEREGKQFELERRARATEPRGARNHADRFGGDDGKEIANGRLAGIRPQIGEGHSLELATEGGADPGAGDAKRVSARGIDGKNERVGKHPADRAGLDLATLRCRPAAAPTVPIIEQFAGRRVFHGRLCATVRRVRCRALPIWDMAAGFLRARGLRSRARAAGEH